MDHVLRLVPTPPRLRTVNVLRQSDASRGRLQGRAGTPIRQRVLIDDEQEGSSLAPTLVVNWQTSFD